MGLGFRVACRLGILQDNLFPGNQIGCNKASGVSNPDFEKLAAVYNLDYFCIHDQKQLVADLPAVLQSKSACICEILLQTEYLLLPRAQSHLDENGQIVSCKLETLRYR